MHNFHCPSITNNGVIWFRPMPYEVSTAFKTTEWCCYWSHQPYLMTSFDQALIIIPSFSFKSFACLKFNFWNTFKYTNANPPCIFSKSIHYDNIFTFLTLTSFNRFQKLWRLYNGTLYKPLEVIYLTFSSAKFVTLESLKILTNHNDILT